jgi:hypothetical protein
MGFEVATVSLTAERSRASSACGLDEGRPRLHFFILDIHGSRP